ncbi:serine/arginine-rich splicing factor RSZ21A-like [Dioscorea cayenensis subsp. rotundata]|uniref:Serine/arginine-rich splicing factor RSZ21A-like n=1 Tax=Dioscorea cayennensis subsp. rotundata TaxID=55577 RepID=A0AB40CX40_DIOCR|nr:serine/arginine-rich splicing factor RSZ21A-like [Dioscorea cayenensis subsp. rotundata]XP_039142620.1 serine/arginine-rich splicing factor RSZ21A-like [Dioscorea cayenensis subsp. rotundata]
MWKVYVGNLSSRIREMELADEFRAYGVVRSVWVARNPPGYAFIEFAKRREADDAISSLDGKHGWRVEMSRKSTGGHNCGSYGSENKCRDCSSSKHRTRDCRSKESYKRSPSPRHNIGNKKHSPLRRRSRSKSPFSQNQHADGPLQRRSQGRSPLSENRYADGSPRKMLAQSGSPQSDHSKSPLSVQNNIQENR